MFKRLREMLFATSDCREIDEFYESLSRIGIYERAQQLQFYGDDLTPDCLLRAFDDKKTFVSYVRPTWENPVTRKMLPKSVVYLYNGLDH